MDLAKDSLDKDIKRLEEEGRKEVRGGQMCINKIISFL